MIDKAARLEAIRRVAIRRETEHFIAPADIDEREPVFAEDDHLTEVSSATPNSTSGSQGPDHPWRAPVLRSVRVGRRRKVTP